MQLTSTLEARVEAAIAAGPAAIAALRDELRTEAAEPLTSSLKRKMLQSADDRLAAALPPDDDDDADYVPRTTRSVVILACEFQHRIRVMKTCRDLLGLSIADARAGLDSLQPLRWRWDTSPPWVVVRDLPRADAERVAEALRGAGAEVAVS